MIALCFAIGLFADTLVSFSMLFGRSPRRANEVAQCVCGVFIWVAIIAVVVGRT